jgi:hypothetical protein
MGFLYFINYINIYTYIYLLMIDKCEEWVPEFSENNIVIDDELEYKKYVEKKIKVCYIYNQDLFKQAIEYDCLKNTKCNKMPTIIVIYYIVYNTVNKFNYYCGYTTTSLYDDLQRHLNLFLENKSNNFISNFIQFKKEYTRVNNIEDIQSLSNLKCNVIDYYQFNNGIKSQVKQIIEQNYRQIKNIFEEAFLIIKNYCCGNMDKTDYFIYSVICKDKEFIFVTEKIINNNIECRWQINKNYGTHILLNIHDAPYKLLEKVSCYLVCEAYLHADYHLLMINKENRVNSRFFIYDNDICQKIILFINSEINDRKDKTYDYNKFVNENTYICNGVGTPNKQSIENFYLILKKKYANFNFELNDSNEFLLYSHHLLTTTIEKTSLTLNTKLSYFATLRCFFKKHSMYDIAFEYYKREKYYQHVNKTEIKMDYIKPEDIKRIDQSLPDTYSFLFIKNEVPEFNEEKLKEIDGEKCLDRFIKFNKLTSFVDDAGYIYIILTERTKRHIPKKYLTFKIGKTNNLMARIISYGNDVTILRLFYCCKNLGEIENLILKALGKTFNKKFKKRIDLFGVEYFTGKLSDAEEIINEIIDENAPIDDKTELVKGKWLGKNISDYVMENVNGEIILKDK